MKRFEFNYFSIQIDFGPQQSIHPGWSVVWPTLKCRAASNTEKGTLAAVVEAGIVRMEMAMQIKG